MEDRYFFIEKPFKLFCGFITKNDTRIALVEKKFKRDAINMCKKLNGIPISESPEAPPIHEKYMKYRNRWNYVQSRKDKNKQYRKHPRGTEHFDGVTEMKGPTGRKLRDAWDMEHKEEV